jgi:hypothetical protein
MDGVMLFDLQATSRLQSAGGQPPPPPSMDDINVNELAGVEFYAGEATAPPGYRQSGCGLLMLWTREK